MQYLPHVPKEKQECGLPPIAALLPNLFYVFIQIYANILYPSLPFKVKFCLTKQFRYSQ